MPESRAPCLPEFRRQMVDLVGAGRPPEGLAREFEPTAQSIGAWVAAADKQGGIDDQSRAVGDLGVRAGRRADPRHPENAMNLLNIQAFYRYIVRGLILLAAVLLDNFRIRAIGARVTERKRP